jgi:inhibitor of KinA sporulation pathway (predicted exonuclease)
MGARLDRVIVVDVEATCWATREEQGILPNEIIEIGIAQLLRGGEICDVSSYIVRPLRGTPVTPFCTQLTGWTQADIDEGSDIRDVLQAIQADYKLTKDHVWFSCGEYDRVKLGSQGSGRGSLHDLYGISREHNIFAQMRHLNIKTLYALRFGLQKEIGMERMLEHAGEKLDGRHHNGADDAANIAKLVRRVLGWEAAKNTGIR